MRTFITLWMLGFLGYFVQTSEEFGFELVNGTRQLRVNGARSNTGTSRRKSHPFLPDRGQLSRISRITEGPIVSFLAGDLKKYIDLRWKGILPGKSALQEIEMECCVRLTRRVWVEQIQLQSFAEPFIITAGGFQGAPYLSRAPLLPQPLAQAATWDPQLLRRVGALAAYGAQSVGVHLIYGPSVGLCEMGDDLPLSYGSEAFLVSRLIEAFLDGVREAGGVAVALRDVKEFTNSTSLLRVVKLGIKKGAVALVLDMQGQFRRREIVGTLREQLQFEGIIIADCSCYHTQVEALLDRVDVCLHKRMSHFPLLDGRHNTDFENHYTSAARKRVENLLFKESPASTPQRMKEGCMADAVDLAGSLARESVTLLHNSKGVIPLDPATATSILVMGPAGNSLRYQLGCDLPVWRPARGTGHGTGDWVDSERVLRANRSVRANRTRTLVNLQAWTVFEALDQLSSPASHVTFAPGCTFSGAGGHPENERTLREEALAEAAAVDYVVFVMGDSRHMPLALLEPAKMDRNGAKTGMHGKEAPRDAPYLWLRDIRAQEFFEAQEVLLVSLLALNKRLLLVLMAGYHMPLSSDMLKSTEAVIHAYQPGPYGGHAVASVLFGANYPYTREVLIRRSHELAGEARATPTSGSLATEMAGRVLDAQKPFKPRKKQRAAVETGKVYTPDDMQRLIFEKERAKAEKEKLKRQRLEEKRKKKEEREAATTRTKEDRARWKRKREEAKSREAAAKWRRAKEMARRAEEKEAADKATADWKEKTTCMSCGARWRGGQGWKECERWEMCGFTQCPKCWRKRRNELLDHETVCKYGM